MEVIRLLTVAVLKLLARMLLKVQLTGLEHMPAGGPAIVAINHINFIEPLLLYAVSPREVIGLGKVEIWQNPIQSLIARSLHLIPLRRGELDLNAVRLALQVLSEGGVLGVAPEGTRSQACTLAAISSSVHHSSLGLRA